MFELNPKLKGTYSWSLNLKSKYNGCSECSENVLKEVTKTFSFKSYLFCFLPWIYFVGVCYHSNITAVCEFHFSLHLSFSSKSFICIMERNKEFYHNYANHTHIYISISPGNYNLIQELCECSEQINNWMCQNIF